MKILMFLQIGLLFSLPILAQEIELNTKEPIVNDKKSTEILKPKSSKSSHILGMSVTGNKESPRSLTIVPWRDPLMDGKKPLIVPVWQPTLRLLDPDAYRRDINLFLEQRTKP